MDYRELAGNSVSLLGYGCMRFPTNEAGEIDERARRSCCLGHMSRV